MRVTISPQAFSVHGMNRAKIRILAINLILVVAVAGVGFWGWSALHPKAAAAAPVTTIARIGDVSATVSASGKVISPGDVGVNPTVAGTLTKLFVAAGDHVKAGQTLAKLDPTAQNTALIQASTSLMNAKAALAKLKPSRTVAEQAQAALQLQQSQNSVDVAQANLDTALNSQTSNAATYQASVDSAKKSLADAQALADLNKVTYQNSVDTSKTNLDVATAAIDPNKVTYQNSIDAAKRSLVEATATAELNKTSYQSSVDTAKNNVDIAISNADANKITYQASVDAANLTFQSAQVTASNYLNTWGPYGYSVAYCQSLSLYGYPAANINDIFSKCSNILSNNNSLFSAKANYASALASQTNNIKKDAQAIVAAQTAYTNAQLSQTLNLNKDAQNLENLQTAIDTAVANQASNIKKDAQSVVSAQAAYASAQQNQTTSLKKDAQNLANLQSAVDTAVTNQTNNLAKDAQTNSQTLTSLRNSLNNAKLSFSLFQAQQAIALQQPKQSDVDAAQASIEIAQASYNLAQKNFAATTIKAPVAGDIASISSTVGQSVSTGSNASATAGTVSGFIVLTNVSSLRVQAGFSESDTAKLQVGLTTSFNFEALPNVTPTGTVSAIDLLPTTSSGATSYTVTFDLDSPVAGLKPGMSATATVTTGSVVGVLQVSAQAVTTRGTRSTVNVVTKVAGKDLISSTRVVVGLQGDSSDEILSGIKAGDVIALRTSTSSVGSNGFPTGTVPSVTGAGTLTGGTGGGFGGGGGRGGGG